jgi:hypothetical protein
MTDHFNVQRITLEQRDLSFRLPDFFAAVDAGLREPVILVPAPFPPAFPLRPLADTELR